LLIDENLSSQLVVEAHEHGHGARWVDSMPGRSDRTMLDERRTLGERLVIRDVRCATMVFARMGMDTTISGVVLIRAQRRRHIRPAWQRYVKREDYLKQSHAVLYRCSELVMGAALLITPKITGLEETGVSTGAALKRPTSSLPDRPTGESSKMLAKMKRR
jgi:hypothetical protein